MKPGELAQQAKGINRVYWTLFSTPDGQKVLDDLRKCFDNELLRKAEGKMVDPNATIAAVGSHRVIRHIEDRINDGKLAR